MTSAGIGVGLIGAGSIARFHADAVRRAGMDVRGVCDINEAKARELADHAGAPYVTTDLDAMLDRDDIVGVVVAVPNVEHKACAVRALDAGKHVLLEKPMAMTMAECDEILAARDRSGRTLQLGFVSRCSPAAQAVRRLIDDGAFGRIYAARAQWYRRRGIPGLGGWFTQRAYSGGGVLIDLGVHLVDLVLHLTDRPAVERVSGVTTSTFGEPIESYRFTEMWSGPPQGRGKYDVEDHAAAMMRCAGGLSFELTVTWAANLPEAQVPPGVLLMGERGGCFFDVWGKTLTVAGEAGGMMADTSPVLPPGEPWDEAWTEQHRRFRHAIETGEAPAAGGEDGREVQAVLEAVYRSSAEGREVAV